MRHENELALERGLRIFDSAFPDARHEDFWGWGPNFDLYVPETLSFPGGVSVEDVEDFATTSCGGDLWFLRAFGDRRNIPVPAVDWYYYNRANRTGLPYI